MKLEHLKPQKNSTPRAQQHAGLRRGLHPTHHLPLRTPPFIATAPSPPPAGPPTASAPTCPKRSTGTLRGGGCRPTGAPPSEGARLSGARLATESARPGRTPRERLHPPPPESSAPARQTDRQPIRALLLGGVARRNRSANPRFPGGRGLVSVATRKWVGGKKGWSREERTVPACARTQ